MKCFAYGSNLDFSRLLLRCPHATFDCRAVLPDFMLAFTRANADGRGTAGVIDKAGSLVWGVVYNIPESDVPNLDRVEGFKPGRKENSYDRKPITVFVDGHVSQPVGVEVYFARQEDSPPLPTRSYLSLIIDGAEHWEFPSDYINWLRTFPTNS